MKKLMNRICTLVDIFKDEFIFIIGLLLALALLSTVGVTEYWGIIGILLVIIILTVYYSYSFFNGETTWQKLAFYIAMLPFLIGYFALIFKAFGVVTPFSKDISEPLNWIDAWYFSTVTWTTLGYGDFRPDDDVTKLFVITEALLGYIYMGVFIGKLLLLGQLKK